jgi:uncharacterized protein YjbI with pentapeptide repeats
MYGPYKDGLSRVKLWRLFNHQVWLTTCGQFGERLEFRPGAGGAGSRQRGNFANHILDGVDLSRAVIVNTSFALSSLRNARFIGAELKDVSFLGCDLDGADFSGATLENVSFDEANYRQARFDGVDTERVHWGSPCVFHRRASDLSLSP